MNVIRRQLKNQKGASIIETLVALGFIAIVSSSFISLAITSRKISFRHRVQNELARYAGMIAEEVVKDYTLTGTAIGEYCSGDSGVGKIVGDFRSTLNNSECSVTKTNLVEEGNYTIILSGEVFGKIQIAQRNVILR